MTTDILVVGAGALGSFFAAALSGARASVGIITRERGIVLDRSGAISRINLPVSNRLVVGQRADFVLLCTKMADLAAALDLLRRLCLPVRPS